MRPYQRSGHACAGAMPLEPIMERPSMPSASASGAMKFSTDPDDDDPSLALYLACERGDGEAAKTALLAGGDPNYVGESGSCPLAFAAYAGDKKLCRLLISFDAAPSAMAIDSAQAGGHISLAEYLRTQQGAAKAARQMVTEGAHRVHIVRTFSCGVARCLRL